MRDREFTAWLKARAGSARLSAKAIANRVSRARRVERVFGDLDTAFTRDQLAGTIDSLRLTKADMEGERLPPSQLVPSSLDPVKQMRSLSNAVRHYRRFLEALAPEHNGDSKWPELEEFRLLFLEKCPDFSDFEQRDGAYYENERSYKDAMINKIRPWLEAAKPDVELGRDILKLISTGSGALVRWQTNDTILKAPPDAREKTLAILGHLSRADGEIATACEAAAADIEEIRVAQLKGLPASEVLSVVATVAGFCRPDLAAPVRKTYAQLVAKKLTGASIFDGPHFTAADYLAYLNLAKRVFDVMRDEWQWKPRDLVDVQGFFWVVADDRWKSEDAEDDEQEAVAMSTRSRAVNLILYGPPGTGKTYRTVAEAVRLCEGLDEDDPLFSEGRRHDLKERYDALVDEGRVSFVSFHQSFSYEEFVEGLRPEQGSAGDEAESRPSAGFNLIPHAGVFKRIADKAALNKGRPAPESRIDRNRKVFKMSLGAAGQPEGDRIYPQAVAANRVSLGYGGNIDWSDPIYNDYTAIRERWCIDHPEARGNDPNISQIYSLRGDMDVGSLVVVSDGNNQFRAIAEVTGPYFYEDGEFNHHRPVRWLWLGEVSLPRENIYRDRFAMRSVYRLRSSDLEWATLEDLIAPPKTAEDDTQPQGFVLVIDEINRGNISKIFGELITLIEPDKRLGEENAITLTLPYSPHPFGIPSNLHIVGTMNTADRSIALLDTALRRRFRFKEMLPRPDLLPEPVEGIDIRKLLTTLNERIEYLFDRDHQIGHAYLMDCESKTKLDDAIRSKVIPLLAEYFYDNWERIRQVLGERDDHPGFIERTRLRAIGEDAEDAETRWRYRVRDDFAREAYAQLGA